MPTEAKITMRVEEPVVVVHDKVKYRSELITLEQTRVKFRYEQHPTMPWINQKVPDGTERVEQTVMKKVPDGTERVEQTVMKKVVAAKLSRFAARVLLALEPGPLHCETHPDAPRAGDYWSFGKGICGAYRRPGSEDRGPVIFDAPWIAKAILDLMSQGLVEGGGRAEREFAERVSPSYELKTVTAAPAASRVIAWLKAEDGGKGVADATWGPDWLVSPLTAGFTEVVR